MAPYGNQCLQQLGDVLQVYIADQQDDNLGKAGIITACILATVMVLAFSFHKHADCSWVRCMAGSLALLTSYFKMRRTGMYCQESP